MADTTSAPEIDAMDEILELYEYNRWANDRVLDAAAALTADELERDLEGSFPSVRATLAHTLGAEWIWLRRWTGTSPSGLPDDWRLDDLAAIRARWAEVEAERSAFLRELEPAGLRREVAYRNTRGEPFRNPLWQLLRHVVNHSTYHRGQVVTMLRQLGRPGVSTDLVLYYREGPGA